jgi:shikimate dehydrogenase
MNLFGLIGFPLSHSFSKKYFTERFLKEGITDTAYENFPIASIEELPGLIAQYPDLKGLNVTIPYKEAVIPFLTHQNDVVKKTSACNCIKIQNGELSGFNTDVIGFERTLKKFLLPAHKKALILGTGGAAKAVGYVLKRLGIEYSYVTRKADAGITAQISYQQLTDEQVADHLLIINTTPLGMYPDTEKAPPINYEMITPAHYLFDLTYNPEKTLFLRNGAQHGATIQNGYDMLVIQAEESWNIWNGLQSG